MALRRFGLASSLRIRIRNAQLIGFAIAISGCSAHTRRTEVLRIFPPGGSLDPNGFLLNPRWHGADSITPPDIEKDCRFRATTGHLEKRRLFVTSKDAACLSAYERARITLNEVHTTLGLGAVCATGTKTGGIRGHVNWFPVTVQGQLKWDGFSKGLQDHDWRINLIPRDTAQSGRFYANAVVQSNHVDEFYVRRGYHTENYFEETLGLIPNQGGSFWQAFKAAIIEDEVAAALVDHRLAIVTGLYGVDAVHNFHAELHPVYGMSILVDTMTTQDGKLREQWAIMVRSEGTQGDCGAGTLAMITSEETALTQNYVVDLGEWPGAGSPDVSLGRSWSTDTSRLPTYSIGNNASGSNHVRLQFTHARPRPAKPGYLFLGTIYLDWNKTNSTPWHARFDSMRVGLKARRDTLNLKRLPEEGTAEAKERLKKLEESLRKADHSGQGDSLLQSIRQNALKIDAVQPQRAQQSALAVPTRTAARAEPTPPWPEPEIVRSWCVEERQHRDVICRGRTRLVLNGGYRFSDGEWSIGIAGYYFPTTAFDESEGIWTQVKRVGQRYEARREPFRRRTLLRDSKNDVLPDTLVIERQRDGITLSFTPVISPSTFRLSDRFIVSPYTFGGPAVSLMEEPRHVGPGLVWGLGLQNQFGPFRLFGLGPFGPYETYLEGQYSTRMGRYLGHWTYSFGVFVNR
jgi:hypothetical protein